MWKIKKSSLPLAFAVATTMNGACDTRAAGVRAPSLESLVAEQVGPDVVIGFAQSRTPIDAISELTSALNADPRFAHGTQARTTALRVLAHLRGADGMPYVQDERQIEILLTGASDPSLDAAARAEIVRALTIAPAEFDDGIDAALFQLLSDPDLSIITTAIQTAGRRGGVDESWLPMLEEMLQNPALANPNAFTSEVDSGMPWQAQETQRARTNARRSAAELVGLSAGLDHSLELVQEHGASDPSIYASMLLHPIYRNNSAFWTADEKQQIAWLQQLRGLLVRPESLDIASCCCMPALLNVAAENDTLADIAAEMATAIANAHPADPNLAVAASQVQIVATSHPAPPNP